MDLIVLPMLLRPVGTVGSSVDPTLSDGARFGGRVGGIVLAEFVGGVSTRCSLHRVITPGHWTFNLVFIMRGGNIDIALD